jgi:hypothetical protein
MNAANKATLDNVSSKLPRIVAVIIPKNVKMINHGKRFVILDVMDEEASEDYSRLAGVSDIDSTNDSVIKTATKRLPWLIIF